MESFVEIKYRRLSNTWQRVNNALYCYEKNCSWGLTFYRNKYYQRSLLRGEHFDTLRHEFTG